MSERTSGRLGLLESMAIVLAVAVACMVVARAEPGLRRCVATLAPINRDVAPKKSTPEADATDMLLHD
ncbi:hypothetical protein [Mesorhizobium sp. LjRoot246]|uniref:hypothetical protein n=1 Tax=Mesorhizobium sp. LjRoot246 TaxID=3342294 RepID=UPI003ECF900A